ncbi:DUF4138 domain-containing protein [Arachidicoccus soli]|uniref:DUF4138 domain-containing protein n=1 Tax=Arachidicoccus soli TaxID=2341117 RepID=A0A386HUE6_9BACT|nr:DUF4138 domain-containing protein [Arachidicoccus soli]
MVLPAFTLANKKYLSILLTEQGGGRQLSLHLSNRQLLKAQLF